MKKGSLILMLGLLLLVAAACSGTTTQPTGEELVVLAHDSFSVSEELIAAFEAETGASVSFILSGDTGAALNRAILTQDTPLADVFYGVDNTFLSRALAAQLFEPYDSPMLAGIPAEFQLDPTHSALPVDFGDVCLNYDTRWFEMQGLAAPSSLEDLIDPAYAGLLVVENPAVSSPGLAFLLATIAQFGEDGYLDFWQALRENGLVVVNDWETAYGINYTASSQQGTQPIMVSYASSPVAEVIYANPPITAPYSAAITAAGTCFRQVEFAGILQGTGHRALAERFIDFLLSVPFQEDVPNQMLVYPVNPEAQLPDLFMQFSRQAESPATIDPELLEANREAWINAWTATVLR